MAKLVSKSQQIITGVMYPKSVYSRVVSCGEYIWAGGGTRLAVTDSLAGRLWLFGIDIWIEMEVVARYEEVLVYIRRGFSDPGYTGSVSGWERVLRPHVHAGVLPWRLGLDNAHLHWDFCKLYEGASQRFVLEISTSGASQGFVYGSFHISEY
ncbi:hypothetical protein ES703_73336 [subsurface metagenome]